MNRHKFKVLFVTKDKFPPYRVDVSILFGKEMVRKGHRIEWVLQSEGACKKGYSTVWQNSRVWIGPTDNGRSILHRICKHMLSFYHNLRSSALILRNDYDIVQVKDRYFTAVLYLLISKLAGIKFVYWLSFPFPESSIYQYNQKTARYPIIYLIRGFLYWVMQYKVIMKYADHIFVQSDQMKRDLRFCGVDKNKMTPIPMGFDAHSFIAEPSDLPRSVARNRYHICYLGTLNRYRRIDFLLRVHYLVIKKIPDAKLFLIGSADNLDDTEFLKQEVRNLGLQDHVIFTGFVERQAALTIVRNTDLCISPFFPTPVLNSTSPTKLIEYMALGKPVVANDHPEQKTVIKESGAGLCVPYDEAAFADAVIYLIERPDLRKQMGEAGKVWAFNHRSYSVICDIVENAYQNL